MTDLQLSIEEKRTVVAVVMASLPRIAIGLLFVWIGSQKFDSTGMWVRVFARIGFGQWFRYLTGTLQVAGGLLLFVPRTALVGAIVLATTMVGAVVTQLLVFKSPLFIIPAILLGVVVALGLSLMTAAKS